MIVASTRYHLAFAVAASVLGIAAAWLAQTPFALLAPLGILFTFLRARTVALFNGLLGVACIASALIAAIYVGDIRETALWWATAFALALLVGAAISANAPASSSADAPQAMRIIESMPGHAWAADPAGKFTYVSPNTTAYLGDIAARDLDAAPEDDEFGWRAVVHPDDYARIVEAWRHCLRTGDRYETEHRIRRADGVYRWFRNSGLPSRDDAGNITGWFGTTIDIDDRKQAELAVRNRERELSRLVDIVPAHIRRLTPTGEPIFFNRRLLDFLGLPDLAHLRAPDDSRLATATRTFVHPEDAAALLDAIRSSMASGEPGALKYRMLRADGVYRWFDSRWEPLRSDDGAILEWFAVSLDIDDAVRAHEALQESKRQLDQMIDAVPFNILSFAPSGRMTYASERYKDQVGAPAAEIEDFDALARDVAHPDDFPRMFRTAKDGFATGRPFVNRFRRRIKDGSYRWIEARAQPLLDAQGAIVQWYVASIDIEDEMQAQEALRERERFLWQLVETLPAMIDCAAPNGEPVYRSQQLREFLGYQLEELDGAGKSRLNGTLDAGVHPDDLAGVKTQYAYCLSTGEPYLRKHRLRRFDGEYRWVETRAAPMRNADGVIVQWNVICLDIDREVRVQEQLRLSQEKLARASQAASLAELSASIAHEVNQPLAAIVANSHACYRWLSAEPVNVVRAKITTERIIRDANSAADVVSRIRALFKQSAEDRCSLVLSSVLTEACSLLADEATRLRVRIDVEVESNLPPVSVDRVQIQQVLVNLIRNGMEAVAPMPGDRMVAVHAHRVGDEVRTEVSDHGRGLEFPDRIFEAFFTTKEHGMGMGLAICRTIVESHGGRLWAENNQPHGARFIFTLPVATKAAP